MLLYSGLISNSVARLKRTLYKNLTISLYLRTQGFWLFSNHLAIYSYYIITTYYDGVGRGIWVVDEGRVAEEAGWNHVLSDGGERMEVQSTVDTWLIRGQRHSQHAIHNVETVPWNIICH